jgi:molecular chaperone Hsp33
MTDIQLKPLAETGDPSASGTLTLGIAGSGDFRWAAVDVTAPLERMRRRLDLSPVAAVALGRTLTAAALLLRFTSKNPGKVRVEIQGDGPLGPLSAEVDSNGRMRGMVGELGFAGFGDGSLDVGRAVGKGFFTVTQESTGIRPYRGQVELQDGEIGSDLVHYLAQSQQIHSAALLGVLPVPEGIGAAGGLLVEALPGADELRLRQLEQNIAGLQGISHYLRVGGAGALRDAALSGLDRESLESHAIYYGCRCTRDELLQRLLTLPSEDLETLVQDQGSCEVVCGFCNGSFLFSGGELKIN